VTQLKAKLASK